MASPRDRREAPVQSGLQVDCLEDPGLQKRITVLKDLVASCRGPQGKAKVIQNSLGGHVTWTKTSSRLFSTMSITTPLLKVIVSAVQGHLERFKDGGLLTAAFCLHLVESSLKLNLSRSLQIELYEKFVMMIDKYLSEECRCKFDVDVFNLNHAMTVLRSVCGPKLSHLNLDVQEKQCALMLDVFLSTLPLNKQDFFSDRVYTLCFENSDIYESKCLKGILVECPELSSLKEQSVKLKTVADGDASPKIKVALVIESMSGDSASFLDAVYEISHQVDCNSVVVDTLLTMCEGLVMAGVGLLLCQRVIHPKVKTFLRQAGVMFVDRLGSVPIPYIRDLTGAVPLSILSSSENHWPGFGILDSVEHNILSEKSYLLLTRCDLPVVTLILKSSTEEVLQELKILSQCGVYTLQLLMREPVVVSGGGCWMTHVGAYLLAEVEKAKSSLQEEFDCSEPQLMKAVENFVFCLQSLAIGTTCNTKHHLTDLKHHHIWACNNFLSHMIREPLKESGLETDSCSCGLLKRDSVEKFEFLSKNVLSGCGHLLDSEFLQSKGFPQVVDCLSMVRNTFKMAVATANTVLSISQYIHDGN